MSLLRVPIYPTRNLAVEIDPGARSIVAGTNVSFTTNADGSITINASGGAGTVTSVGATGSTGLTVGGSPITTSGTLTFTLSANLQSWSGIAPATKANLASPVFTGDPRAPTPATADNDTSVATTAFVKNQGYATMAALGSYVLKAGDTMSGTLTVQARVRVDRPDGEWALLARNAAGTTDRGGLWADANGISLYNANFQSYIRADNDNAVRIGGGASTRVTVTAASTTVNNNLIVGGADLYSYRPGGTTGVIFLNSSGTKYLFNDGTRYQMPTQGLQVGGPIYSDSRWLEGTLGGEGFQIVWNTVQAGQGRTEIINNNGGGAGGFTWWDRTNTSGGLSTAMMSLIGSSTQALTVTGGVYSSGTNSTIHWQNRSGTEAWAMYCLSNITRLWNGTNDIASWDSSGNHSNNGYLWPSAGSPGSKKLSKISIGTAAPSGLIDGELYLRY